MFAWLIGRKSQPIAAPAPQAPAPSALPVSHAGLSLRSHTWPHVASSAANSAPRDIHRHAPHTQRSKTSDAFEFVGSPTSQSVQGVCPTTLASALQRVARRQYAPAARPTMSLPAPQICSRGSESPTPTRGDTSPSDTSGSSFGSGLDIVMGTASIASAPGYMQRARRTSSVNARSINFDLLPHTEATNVELAELRFDAGVEPGMLFPFEVQLPDFGRDCGRKGVTVLRNGI